MKKNIRTAAMGVAFAFALACAAPCAAWVVETPGSVTTIDEAQSWAEAYLDDAPALLSINEEQPGWELIELASTSWDLRAVSPDTSWYSEGASSYTLSTGSQLAGLAELVNSGVTFEGKTVTLAKDIVFIRAEVTPIGGEGGHEFNGTFDGAGYSIRGYSLTSLADAGERATNIALFGGCGEKSVVKNVHVTGATVTVHRSASSSQAVSNVAALIGTSKGSVENCTVDATIDVADDTPQTDTVKCVMSKIGGMAATVFGDVKNCEFSGSLKAITNTAGSDGTDGNGRSPGLIVAKSIGGVVAYLGDPAQEEIEGARTHGNIYNCVFSGSIDSQSPCEAGTDRFGEKISAMTEGVGGIAGFSLGSVYDSTCKGIVSGAQASMTGGIVGSLRGLSMNGSGDSTEIDYGSKDDILYTQRCLTDKNAQVTGLCSGGGIVGSAGSYTVITECANAALVTVNRWNKPAGGGIVGQSHGTVSFCGNTGTVKTATGGGYYVAGIAGMLLQYAKPDGTHTTPTPEVYSCYSAGKIDALPGNKSSGFIGQNDGNLHDCLVLKDTCADGDIYHVVDSSSGTYSNCAYVSATDLRATSAVAALNKQRNGGEWDNYFVLSTGGQNNGYPVLKCFANATSTTPLSSITATCTENAPYTGGEAIPRLEVTMGGKTLTQDVDFYVVPQEGATDLGDGYSASIVGIGSYSGTQSNVCTYSIVKGDLATCLVSIKSSKFDYSEKTLTADDITVTDAYGVTTETVTTTVTKTDGSSTVTKVETKTDDGGSVITKQTTVTETGADGSTTSTTTIDKAAHIVDGHTFYLDKDGNLKVIQTGSTPLYVTRVRYTGFYGVTHSTGKPHAKISNEASADGSSSSIVATYDNTSEAPLPATVSVVLPPKYKTDPDDPSKQVQIPYASAELWAKVLPGGVESAASKWQLAGSLSGDNLAVHATNTPLKIFGRVTLPTQPAQDDEVILLLRLVDADGNASGEAITEGDTEPVVTLPDTKTRTYTAGTATGAEFENTGYTSPFLMRFKFNGKVSLK